MAAAWHLAAEGCSRARLNDNKGLSGGQFCSGPMDQKGKWASLEMECVGSLATRSSGSEAAAGSVSANMKAMLDCCAVKTRSHPGTSVSNSWTSANDH